MIEITVSDVLKNCDVKLLIGREDEKINECYIDSKKKTNCGCFIGIKGEKTDGSLFYKEAFDNGASICILNKIYDLDLQNYDDKTVLIANDTKKVLKQLAIYKRSLFKGVVIGVTGSVGKTSTKEMIFNVLSSKYKVLKTIKNQNSQIGLPLSILRLTDEDVMVLEMGMSNLGHIHNLSLIAKPDISVITNIYDSHIEFLGTRENILKAKLEIIDGMDSGKLIINNDNDLLNNLKLSNKNINIITCGIKEKSDYMANIISDDIITKFNACGINDLSIKGGVPYVYNALIALTIGKLMNVEDELIKEGINKAIDVEKRLEEVKIDNNITIIDDSYNANYESTYLALSYLSKFSGRKIAVLADILELGKNSKTIHKKVGELINKNNTNYLITIGKYSKYISKVAKKNKMNKKFIRHFKDEKSSREFIKSILKNGDILLIKGSNGMKLCNLIEYLKKKN